LCQRAAQALQALQALRCCRRRHSSRHRAERVFAAGSFGVFGHEHLSPTATSCTWPSTFIVSGFRNPCRAGMGTSQNRSSFRSLRRGSGSQFGFAIGGRGLSGLGHRLFGPLGVISKRDHRFGDAIDQKTNQLFVIWFLLCIATTALNIFPGGNMAHGAAAVLGILTARLPRQLTRRRFNWSRASRNTQKP
jgi:hypothetical protein